MSPSRRTPSLFAAMVLLFAATFAHAQAYTSIVVFGDSLSDTGNDATLSAAKYTVNAQVPGPATGYTNGRFTDGTDTSPAARSYNGVWVEQLAAKLAAKPIVKASLLGGTDYAYGFSTTSTGSVAFTYGPGNSLSFPVENMQQQLADYLATNPTINNKTLFVIWGGANDLLQANATNATQIVTQAITNELTIAQTLVAKGGTDFLIVNLPPLGLVPRNNGSPTSSIPANQLSAGFDAGLAGAVGQFSAAVAGRGIHVFQLDTYTLFNTIVGPPLYPGLANVTSMSQGNTTINPDTYMFWDGLHPTTYGHALVAAAALTAIGTPIVTTAALATSNSAVNLGTAVTLTASVTSTTGTPMGSVTFYDGTTSLGSGLVFGATSTATATLTTSSLAGGSHNLTASYVGVNGYTSSTSAAVVETVTAPSFAVASTLQPISVKSGASGTSTINFSAIGGYTGTVTFACGTLPSHFTCSIAPASVTFPSATTSATITIGTSNGTALLSTPTLPGRNSLPGFLAASLFGVVGLLSLRHRKHLRLLAILAFAVVLAAGVTGCGGSGSNPNYVTPGTYSIPVVVTANAVPLTLNLAVTVN